MHAQVHTSTGHVRHSMPNRNSLYTPTYSGASDKEEEEIEGSDPDLSDYYSDSGYPTRPRPRLIVLSSGRKASLEGVRSNPLQFTPPGRLQGKAGAHEHKQVDSSYARSRKTSVVSLPAATRETSCNKTKAFNKLRSLRNNRITPVSSPERERPTSSLVTTSISANGKNSSPQGETRSPQQSVHHKQLRSLSLPEGDTKMAQAKPKKTKKPNRSFSFGSGDKKRSKNTFFRSMSRSGDAVEPEPELPHSPLLVGRKSVQTVTIYEEDSHSLSSVEEEEERLNSMNYLHGNRFGSCRELSSAGLAGGSGDPLLFRPLSRSRHKRPSLPNFAKFLPQSRQVPTTVTTVQGEEGRDSPSRDSDESQTPPGSATSSPRPRGKLHRRNISDPGSAPGTPEAGNSPPPERRPSREGGVARGSRPLRKGFTFSVGGSKLSPDWVRTWGDRVIN